MTLCSSRTGAPTTTTRTSASLQSTSVAVGISQLDFDPASDARWSGIVQRGLNWSEYELFEHCHDGERRSSSWENSVKQRNLIQIARELHTAHQDYYDDPSFGTIFHNTLLSAVRRPDRGAHRTSCGASLARCGTSLSGRCRTCSGGSGAAIECDAHPFPHAHAVRLFARGHRVEMGRVFGDDG